MVLILHRKQQHLTTDVPVQIACWQRKFLTRFQTRWIIRMVLCSALFTQPHHLSWRTFRRTVSHCCSWSVPQSIPFFLFLLLSLSAHCSTKNFLVEPHSFGFKVRAISYFPPRGTRVGIRLGSLRWVILQTFEHFHVFLDPWVELVGGFQWGLT